MAKLQQTYVFHVKNAMGSLGATDIVTTGTVATGALTVTGAATVSTTLGVTGASTLAAVACTTLDPSGLVQMAAAATVGTTLGVTGASTLAAVACTTLDPSGLVQMAAAATVGTTLGVTGVSTLTGGVAGAPPIKIWNHVPAGALATRGTDAAVGNAGDLEYAEVFIPMNVTLTGMGWLNGTTDGTDKIRIALYDSTGALVASSAAGGALSSGADAYQQLAFSSAYAAVGPARYFGAVTIEGTTAATQRHTTLGPLAITGTEAATWDTLPDPIASLATTHTDAIGPMFYLYS